MSTTTIDVQDAEAHLSEYVAKLRAEDRIVLCRENRPVAEIRPLPDTSSQPRPIGLGKGLAEIPDSFFEPLPDDIYALFEAFCADEDTE